jgi:hypothetical protein
VQNFKVCRNQAPVYAAFLRFADERLQSTDSAGMCDAILQADHEVQFGHDARAWTPKLSGIAAGSNPNRSCV